jgi:hypothetical protein
MNQFDLEKTEAYILSRGKFHSMRSCFYSSPILNVEKISLILTILLSLTATAISYSTNKILSYNDATAHLNIARRVIDNINPGLVQLGSVWLPLLHVLEIPFVANNFLWQSGLAGSIVSGASFVLASWFLFKLIVLYTDNPWAALLGSLALATNLNLLYLQSTPMFEPLLIATVMGAVYYIGRWGRSNAVSDLTLGSFWTMLATLTRYDGWAFFLLAAILVAILTFVLHRQKREGPLVLFIMLAGFGIFLWLLYNYVIFHDPLYFQRSEYSAAAQQQILYARGELPTEHNLLFSIKTYSITTLLNLGPISVTLSLIGLLWYCTSRLRHPEAWIPLLLVVPFFFNIVALYTGQSVIWLPFLPPDFDTYFNARYGILMLPAAAFFIGWLASRHITARWLMAVGIVVQIILFLAPGILPLFGRPVGLVTLQDTVSSVNPQTIAASAFLHQEYTGGNVLVSSASSDAFIFRANLPLKDFITEGTGGAWTHALAQPEKTAAWIVMFNNHTDRVGKALGANPVLTANYEQVYQDPTYQIWSSNTLGISAKLAATKPVAQVATLQLWPTECIDTMKTSRDNARLWAARPDLTNEIDAEMTTIASTGANCVAIDTPYDAEFSNYLKAYVYGARQHGLRVWFRGNWSGWEGWFGYKATLTSAQLLAKTSAFIKENPTLFQNGDIFTAAPEAENGGPFKDLTPAIYPQYRQFLLDEQATDTTAFKAIGKQVTTNWLSMNGGTAEKILSPITQSSLGNVATIDHYIKDPSLMGEFIDHFQTQGAQTVVGEFGAPIPQINGSMTESEQAAFVGKLLAQMYQRKDSVLAVNYWTLDDGSTALVNPDGTPRQVLGILKDYYSPGKLVGKVENSTGSGVAASILIDGIPRLQTSPKGLFQVLIPAGTHTLTITPNGLASRTLTLKISSDQVTHTTYRLGSQPTPAGSKWLSWLFPHF